MLPSPRLALDSIIRCSNDAIVTKTLDGIVASWNPGAERLFGYTAAEAIGRPITILFPPDRLDEEKDFLARISGGEFIEHFETIRVRKDGEHIHVSVTLSPITDETGRIIGASKIARDINERVKLIARERAARQEAEAANRLKDEFLATLSHELRTPLNAVFGWVRMLESGRLEPAMEAHALEVIARNCTKQLALIDDLLDMSRIVTGRLQLRMRTLGLAAIVEAAVEAITPAVDAKGVRVQVAFDPKTPDVMGDSDRLDQVVSNLLTNALKFTARGGLITVRLTQAGSRVNLTVQDDGAGIAPDVLPHVFERLRQGDSSSTRKHDGLGLGLAIVRHIVDLHGGIVRAWSEGEGCGATFTVTLPVAALRVTLPPIAADDERFESETFAGALKGARIVVVDDDRDSRELVGEVLRRAGAVVFLAGSANDALGLIVTERPDALVSDLGMPDEDGLALIKRVRSMPEQEFARVRALALTAYSRSIDRSLAVSAGFDTWLGKPVDPPDLVQAVCRLLG